MKQSTKKNAGAPCQSAPAKQSTCSNCTTCHCGKQAEQPALFEIPPPATEGGGLVDYLESHAGFHRQEWLCTVLGTNRRDIRRQAEHSGGKIIFTSSGDGGGLCHSAHADPVAIRSCAAELRRRADAHLRRVVEIEQAAARMVQGGGR